MLKRVSSAGELLGSSPHNPKCPVSLSRRVNSSNNLCSLAGVGACGARTPSRLQPKPGSRGCTATAKGAPLAGAAKSPSASPSPLKTPRALLPPKPRLTKGLLHTSPSKPSQTPSLPSKAPAPLSPASPQTAAPPPAPAPAPLHIYCGSQWSFSTLQDLLGSCEQLQLLMAEAHRPGEPAQHPPQSIIGTTCKLLAASLRRACKQIAETLTAAPSAWLLSRDAGVTITEFGYADLWTLDAKQADAKQCLERMDLLQGGRVRCCQRSAVDQPWEPVGLLSVSCLSGFWQQPARAGHTTRKAREQSQAFVDMAAQPATITQACKLALEQGLSLDGLASLLQAAADGLAAQATQLQQESAARLQAQEVQRVGQQTALAAPTPSLAMTPAY